MIIVFREPFPVKDNNAYYINAIVNYKPEKNIRINDTRIQKIMDFLVKHDKKLTNAILFIHDKHYTILKHSPQSDFFDMID